MNGWIDIQTLLDGCETGLAYTPQLYGLLFFPPRPPSF